MNVYYLKRTALFLIALILIAYQTGCADSKEIDTLAFVTGIGFDYSDEKDKTLEFSAQIARVSSLGENGDSQEPFIVKTVRANYVHQAMEKLRFSLSRTPFYQHHQVIVVGREQAEHGMEKYLDALMRHHEIRMESLFLVSDGKATDFLKAEIPLNKISSLGISGMISHNIFGQVEIENKFLNFMSKTVDYGKTALVPIVKLVGEGEGQSVSVSGFAVFKEGKMIYELKLEDYIGCVIITNELSKGTIEVSGDWGKAGLLINKSSPSSKTHVDAEGKITYNVDVNIRLSVEYLDLKDGQPDLNNIHEIEKVIESQLIDDVQKALKISKEINADIFEIGKDLSKFYPTVWRERKDDWYKYYRNVVINPNINVEIEDIGKTGDMPELGK